MSIATNGWLQPSKGLRWATRRMVGVAPNGRLWYKSAAPTQPNGKSVPKIVRYGYAPDVTAPRGTV